MFFSCSVIIAVSTPSRPNLSMESRVDSWPMAMCLMHSIVRILLKADSHRLSLWSVGRISSGDLFVSPNGSFNVSYTNSMVDERIAGVRYRLRLVDPEHPELSPLFTDSILGLKSIQTLYTGKEPKNLLDMDGGYDQIWISTKMFERVCTSFSFSKPSRAAYITSRHSVE